MSGRRRGISMRNPAAILGAVMLTLLAAPALGQNVKTHKNGETEVRYDDGCVVYYAKSGQRTDSHGCSAKQRRRADEAITNNKPTDGKNALTDRRSAWASTHGTVAAIEDPRHRLTIFGGHTLYPRKRAARGLLGSGSPSCRLAITVVGRQWCGDPAQRHSLQQPLVESRSCLQVLRAAHFQSRCLRA